MACDLPARMLRLLSLLQTRRSWAGHELAERLEVTLPDRVHALDDHTSRVELSSDNPRDITAQLLGLASHTTTITGTPELATHLEQLGEFLRHSAHTLTTPTADQHPS
ncbi:hypothetical protein [Nocardia brasiliensis]|uniref:hypothetical protein n=1 Tax=Nocardia brasiliensis TaxID=37326 RepID=UPI002456E0F7|nr:hypothetical protein [Nocardia brasiliensis]